MSAPTTPTDWRLVDERGAGGFLYVDCGPDLDFLRVENEEQGRLIATAPDLLRTLKALRQQLLADRPKEEGGGLVEASRRGAMAMVREAIAKTEGLA